MRRVCLLVGCCGRLCVLVFVNMCLGRISEKWLEIETRLRWNTYRKWYMANRMVTCSMASRDLTARAGLLAAWRRT